MDTQGVSLEAALRAENARLQRIVAELLVKNQKLREGLVLPDGPTARGAVTS
jgi:hypothetical protein